MNYLEIITVRLDKPVSMKFIDTLKIKRCGHNTRNAIRQISFFVDVGSKCDLSVHIRLNNSQKSAIGISLTSYLSMKGKEVKTLTQRHKLR